MTTHANKAHTEGRDTIPHTPIRHMQGKRRKKAISFVDLYI